MLENCIVQFRSSVARKCPLASRHFVENQSKRKQVCPCVQLLPSYLLRRHVTCGPHCHTRSAEQQPRARCGFGLSFCATRTIDPSIDSTIRVEKTSPGPIRGQLGQAKIQNLGLSASASRRYLPA